ncbi:phosphocholine cytidylyltransferase family protein [Methanothermobacter tenebrarum]
MVSIKVVILAAGVGSRLGHGLPKALVKLCDEKTILDHQLENLKSAGLEDIRVVIGYKGGLIKERHPDLEYVINRRYYATNTSKSLLIGIRDLDEDVIWLNGDVVFDPRILHLIMEERRENLICVDNKKVGDEEVKYNLTSDGYIKKLSKTIPDGLGEAVGINYVKRETLPVLEESLMECHDQDYFEKAIEKAIEKGEKFKALNIKDNFCIEVDFPEDLEKAKKYCKENL